MLAGTLTVSAIIYDVDIFDGVVELYNSYIKIRFVDLKSSSNGYAYEFNLGTDVAGSEYPYTTVTYRGMVGMLMYDGNVNNKNIISVNHWATYGHKRFSILADGINFSIPFATGFSIKIGGYYNQLTEEHTWRRK